MLPGQTGRSIVYCHYPPFLASPSTFSLVRGIQLALSFSNRSLCIVRYYCGWKMTPNIPLELQELIITEGREDYAFLLVCALVRQAWVPVSRSLLDIHVKLFSDRDFSHINRDIALPDTTLAQSIRSVHIDYRKTTKNYDRVLQEAFTKIPSIHTLTLDCAVLLSSNDESLDIVYNAFSRITALKLHDVRCDFSSLVIFLSRFQHLKYLAIDEVSFIYEDIGFQPLYSTLSPSLRELTLPTEFYEDEDGGYVKMLDWIGKSAPALRWLTVSFPPEFTTIMADMIQSLQANAVLEMQCVIFNAENLLEEYTSGRQMSPLD